MHRLNGEQLKYENANKTIYRIIHSNGHAHKIYFTNNFTNWTNIKKRGKKSKQTHRGAGIRLCNYFYTILVDFICLCYAFHLHFRQLCHITFFVVQFYSAIIENGGKLNSKYISALRDHSIIRLLTNVEEKQMNSNKKKFL